VTIQLDYSNAEVFVEAGGESKPAVVVDADGNPLAQTELKIVLSNRDRLVITRGRTSLLTVDFDLDASHAVDFISTPAIATAEPFIVAEIDPVDTKEIRVRGRFIEANESEMYYTVAIRPFHDRIGDFGRMQVFIDDETTFEVDGSEFLGIEGLRALNAAGQGTLTVAQGTLDVSRREFTAAIVLAGSSVPGDGELGFYPGGARRPGAGPGRPGGTGRDRRRSDGVGPQATCLLGGVRAPVCPDR
jgi:hypothetical protein